MKQSAASKRPLWIGGLLTFVLTFLLLIAIYSVISGDPQPITALVSAIGAAIGCAIGLAIASAKLRKRVNGESGS